MTDLPTPLNNLTTAPQITAKKETTFKFPFLRLGIPLLLQIALILAVPVQKLYTYNTGRLVTLQTVPVDPYDLMRGYSQTLSYDISNPDLIKKLPGYDTLSKEYMSKFYLILQATTSVNEQPPKPWKPVRVSQEKPQQLADNEVVLLGKYTEWSLIYELETYYMPEDQREQLNRTIQQTQQQAFVVDIKVDKDGHAVPVSLWLRDQQYSF